MRNGRGRSRAGPGPSSLPEAGLSWYPPRRHRPAWSERLRSFGGGRIREPVTDGDHALDVPGLIDDVPAEDDAARLTLHRHDPIFHGDREPGRVGEEPIQDHVLSDLAANLLIG